MQWQKLNTKIVMLKGEQGGERWNKLLVATHYDTGGGSTGTITVPMSLAIERKTVSFEWNGGSRATIKIPNSTSMSMASIHSNTLNYVVVMGIK